MLACLRMLLALRGTKVTEASLVQQSTLEQGGIDPDQLVALALRLGLKAQVAKSILIKSASLVREERFPIVLVDRSVLDHEFSVHAVIPVRVSRKYVTVLDPLRGERRISMRKFIQAQRRVDSWAVVWEP